MSEVPLLSSPRSTLSEQEGVTTLSEGDLARPPQRLNAVNWGLITCDVPLPRDLEHNKTVTARFWPCFHVFKVQVNICFELSPSRSVQEYLAHKKTPPRRTLQ